MEHELYVVEDIPDLHVSFMNETYMVKLKPGLIMADTGCKKAVAGSEWHQELQAKMDKEGKGYSSYLIHEYFKFGPGHPIPAVRGWNYNVGINGFNEEIQIAEIDADVPGLCGPDDMARWKMKLDFE